MASIENKSRYVVTVKGSDQRTRAFSHNRLADVKRYISELKAADLKPQVHRTNDSYVIRVRERGHVTQTLSASSEQEAVDIKARIELERRGSLFIDYAKGRRFSFADLIARYLREVAPRHKGFEVEGYILNAILDDAGLPRVDMAQAYAAHKAPHPSLASKTFRKPSGKAIRTPTPTSCFILKPFADVVPDDFNDYRDERSLDVKPATVSRELDLFSAICAIAIDTWRIPVAKSPMDGVDRKGFYNERDRRLKPGEEARLLSAAVEEDRRRGIAQRLDELVEAEREQALASGTTYRRKMLIQEARERHRAEAEATYVHVPTMEAFIHFQLMTAARRSETLSLPWASVDFAQQTAFIAETKNGRPRTLALRRDLLDLLEELPRATTAVFDITLDGLRKAWSRICASAGLTGDDALHVHDLRHEAISRVADAGSLLPGGFSLVDLQAFSGHRDTRMLLRYTHLCMPSFAKRLDAVFKAKNQTTDHAGRRRLRRGAALTMNELVQVPDADAPCIAPLVGQLKEPTPTQEAQNDYSSGDVQPVSNVLPFRRRTA